MAEPAKLPLDCWKCGSGLEGVERPIRRSTICPACRADLHVCRQCVHYDRTLIRRCRHDRADNVMEKERANFCGYFLPARGIGGSSVDQEAEKAQSGLAALFGLEGEEAELPGVDVVSRQQQEAERARSELEDLFGLDDESADDDSPKH
jgi:hypothetical protein